MNILTMMEAFAGVVETGSFTAAAELLGLSKSFVSKQVSQLETELDVRLLYRTTRRLSLSDEGTRFYNHCKLIMAEADDARAEVIESQSNLRGIIRIAAASELNNHRCRASITEIPTGISRHRIRCDSEWEICRFKTKHFTNVCLSAFAT